MFHKLFAYLDVRQRNKQLLFIVLVFFLIAFALSRAFAVFIGTSIFIHGYQIHHFYFGTLILACSSLVALLRPGPKMSRLAAALCGVGIGLFADEIGLLLNCTTRNHLCSYVFPDYGDIILTIAAIIILLIIFSNTRQEQ